MDRYHFPRSFLFDIAACVAATVLVAAFAFGTYGLEFGSAEEGPLETIQEWFLAAAFLFLAASALKQPRGAARLASICGAILVAIFFFRELEPVGQGPIATYFQSGAFRLHETIAIALLALAIIPTGIRFVPEIARWVFSRSSWPFLLAGACVLVGEWLDGHHVFFGIEWLPRAIEETFETFAYAVILACSQRWHGIARTDRPPS